MKSPKASVRTQIPSTWLEQFEQLAAQTGRSTSELVKEALEQYLIVNNEPQGKEIPLEEPTDLALKGFSQELETIKTELAQLRQQVEKLSSYSQLVTTTNARLTVLERLLNNNNSSVATMANSDRITNLNVSQEEDDDSDCDEPDEILTDFLPRDKW